MSDCTVYIQKRKVYHELGSVSADFNIRACDCEIFGA